MYFFLVGFAVALHILFWGLGGAILAMPRPWVRYWPILMAPLGLALQSLVVWAGAYTNLAGTDRYALASEGLPVAMLAFALWRRGAGKVLAEAKRFSAVGFAVGFCLFVLLGLLAVGSKGGGLNSISLGSCDAADYAAGARLLKEYARSDRTGFIGLTEVVKVMSTDNFFDYFLRLNHFTPSALVAFNGSVVDCQPHELTSIICVVILATSLPLVFWVARAVLRYGSATSLWIALLYGLSPVTWYAVFQVAPGQLLAAQAIALLTWGGIALWRSPLGGREAWRMGMVLGAGYVLVLGSYNFILLVALVPAIAGVGGMALWQGHWRKFVIWALAMAWPFLVSGLLMFDRVAGLAERFRLLRSFDFGWHLPVLSPEGWLGMLPSGFDLAGFPVIWRVLLAGAVIVLASFALARARRRRRRIETFIALGLAGPAIIGYTYLNLRGLVLGTNASYDAYKLLAVFYPGVLAVVCCWMTLLQSRRGFSWWPAAGLAVVTAGLLAHAALRFAERLADPLLGVGRELLETKKVETMDEVASVNVLVPDMWARLWINAFALKKPQYFLVHSYEARKNTPLRGDWDLNGGIIEVQLPGGASRRINGQFSLADTRSPYFLRAQVGNGWYDLERQQRAIQRWQWTKGNADITLENLQAHPLRVVCRFVRVHSLAERNFEVWASGQRIGVTRVGPKDREIILPEFLVPPGLTRLEIRSDPIPRGSAIAEERQLGFRVFGIKLEVLAESIGG